MTVLLTGGTGFIGSRLVDHFLASGDRCVLLVRKDPDSYPIRESIRYVSSLNGLSGVDAVINLAGESILGLWTPEKKRRILESRVQTTKTVVEWITGSTENPKVFLSGSAIGIYGDRPGEILAEASEPDPTHSFRSQVCLAWEAEALKAEGVRVVLLRIGNIIQADGGVVCQLAPFLRRVPFFMSFGAGRKTSHIRLTDAVAMIDFALRETQVQGPFNVVDPEPISWDSIVRGLAKDFKKPVFGTIPAWILKIVLGEMSHALLDNQEIQPAKATALGFKFPASLKC